MLPMYSAEFYAGNDKKTIAVYNCNILAFDEQIDILTTSAFLYSYAPTPRTIFAALAKVGVSVSELAQEPQIDLRKFCNVWLSRELDFAATGIRRIGCIEMLGRPMMHDATREAEQGLLNSIQSYFQMLDIASTYGIPMETIALPLLGSGRQGIDANMIMIPVINACVSFLKRNSSVKRICFVEMNPEKAGIIAEALMKSYLIHQEQLRDQASGTKALAFISYASADKNIADNLCAKLERQNVKVWYAPRDVKGPYAAAIAEAIGKATHFVVILSENSMHSQHVLNEIDLAFQSLPDNIKFKPLRIDQALFTPSFKYYLSRQHWMDAIIPPLETRLDEFVSKLVEDL